MNPSIRYLLDNANPVIRYRTLKELCDNTDPATLSNALQAVLAFPETQKRLGRLKAQNVFMIHGGYNYCLEVTLPMLGDFGINKETGDFGSFLDIDEVLHTYRTTTDRKLIHNICLDYFYAHMFRAGYRHPEIDGHFRRRIDTIHGFTKQKDWDIYISEDSEEYPRKYPLKGRVMKPVLWDSDYIIHNGNFARFRLPQMQDIIGFIELYPTASEDVKFKIDDIISYIDSPDYNRFQFSYGGLLVKGKDYNKGYKAMGWDCMLPLYHKDIEPDYSLFLHRMELFSHFPGIVKGKWFNDGLALLETYKTERGTYLLPEDYLREKNNHWILGNHMKLGEGRSPAARELESTFWVMKIKKNGSL